MIGSFSAPTFFHFFDSANYKLVIDLKVDKGDAVGIFINQNYFKYYSKKLVLNQRTKYSFEDLPDKISDLRIDPTGDNDASIDLYNISIYKNNQVIESLGPSDLLKWGAFFASTPAKVVDDHVNVVSTTNDPIIMGKFHYTIPFSDKIGLMIGATPASFSLTFSWVLLFCLMLVGIFKRQLLEWGFFISALFFLAFLKLETYLVPWCLEKITAPLRISQSVGIASYSGVPKPIEIKTFLSMLLLAIIFGVLLYYLLSLLSKIAKFLSFKDLKNNLVNENKFSNLFFFSIFITISIFNFPAIKKAFDLLPNIDHAHDWDSMAVFNWQYVANLGLLPFRDYWFPYGGYWNQISPFPWDMFRFHIYKTIVFGVFSLCIYALCNFRKLWTLLILSIVLILVETGYLKGFYRYVMCIDITLLYLVIINQNILKQKWLILYGVFVGWILSYEPTQAIYGAVPVLLVFFRRNFQDPKKLWQNFLLHLPAIISFSAIVFIFIAKMLIFKQWSGFLDFYQNMGAISVADSTPGGLLFWKNSVFQEENLVLIATLWLVLLGTYFYYSDYKQKEYKIENDLIMSMGVLASMIFLKHLVRPFMANQFIIIHILALLLYLVRYSTSWSKTQKSLGFLSLGCFLGWGFQTGLTKDIVGRYVVTPKNLIENIEVLALDEVILKKQQDLFFSPENFINSSPDVRDIYNFFNALEVNHSTPEIFVLGDDSLFYIILKKIPPPFVSVYDGSALYAQQTILNWLTAKNPEYVIWNSSNNTFDNVPNPVRVPLLYEYVAKNYLPFKKFGKYFVLKKRSDKESIDLAFWKENLGQELSLGYVPAESNIKDLEPCKKDAVECYQVLELTPLPEKLGQPLKVSFIVGNETFAVQFLTRKSTKNYYITLNRLWFWSLANASGQKIDYLAGSESFLGSNISKHSMKTHLLY